VKKVNSVKSPRQKSLVQKKVSSQVSQARGNNTVWHRASVTREDRARLNGHQAAALWFTGLSGAGKSTLAHAVERRLHEMRCQTFVLDGDNVRHGLCKDLGFSRQDRAENIRRIGEVIKLFLEAGTISLAAFISPFREDRDRVRALLEPGQFIEIYCSCPLDICEKRDTKGLYRRARQGEILEFTGISSPYEMPQNPELLLNTGTQSLDNCVRQVIEFLAQRGIVIGESSSVRKRKELFSRA
jgi:adenylylsulfate kinase